MAQRIRGILFDLGDTLLDFGHIDAPRLFYAGAELAYAFLRRLKQPLPEFHKYHRRQLRAVKWNYLKSRLTGREFNSLDLMARIGQGLGHDLTDEQMLELAWLWYRPLGKTATVERGLAEMLVTLRGQGLTLAVVSNTFVPPGVLDRHLAQEGLLEHLPIRVYSSEVGYRKPGRRIFNEALDRCELAPAETMFVGDSLWADIRGANRMGMVSVLKDPAARHRHGRIRPHYRIRSILKLPAVLRRCNGDE
jgi:HAD superfamily hydrolase (TIGR01509 family)